MTNHEESLHQNEVMVIAMSQILSAINGNVTAAREIREAVEGKVGERSETALAQETTIRVIYDTVPPQEVPNGAQFTSNVRAREE